MMDLFSLENSQAPDTNSAYSSYIIDFFFFVLLVVLLQVFLLKSFYAPFFFSESSGAFMQFTYYVEALRDNASLYWDHYLMLSTQEMPMSPLLSPVTLILTGAAYFLNIFDLVSLVYMYAFATYSVQVLCGYTMYLFLRSIGLSRLAAIVGGIGYGFNYFTITYGMPHGFFRLSALALMPVVFIFFVKLFSDRRNTLYYLALSGFFLGLTFVLNGDVKPAIYFMPVLVILAYTEGWEQHGPARTTWLLLGVFVLGAFITFAQFYPTLEALGEGVRSERTRYLPSIPNHPFNTLLGFSQNPFSFVLGFFFPHSFYEYYRLNLTLGIAKTHLHEQKFTFGIFLFLLSSVGVFYRTRRHLVWAISLLVFALYVLGSSTPLWPLFGFISEQAHIRYPTRAAIMPYFFLSIYAAYGIDVLLARAGGGFYEEWAARYIKYILAFILIICLALFVTSLEMGYDLFGVLRYTDHLTLFVSRVLILFLVLTLSIAAYISWKKGFAGLAGARAGARDTIFLAVLWARLKGSGLRDLFIFSFLHALLSWISLRLALNALKLWLLMGGATGEEFTVVFFVEATFPLAVLVFVISYILVAFILTRGFALLSFSRYSLLFLLSAAVFNTLFALGGAQSAIHVVYLGSLAVLAAIIIFVKYLLHTFGPFDLKTWREEPCFLRHTMAVVVVLFALIFALFIFSGFMGGYLPARYLIVEIGGLKIQREFLVVLIGLVLFLLTILSGRKRAWPLLVLSVSIGAYLFIYTDATGMRVPPALMDEPSLVFKRDAELRPIYEDKALDEYRIYIPREVRRNSLSPELGFSKSHHSYCCRQYKDNLRFAFGQIVGPKTLEKIRRTIFNDYSHPFWKLYNVGYIVDRFDLDPALLPVDPDSYERLSDMVIKIKSARPRLYFMDSYEYADIDEFIENIKGVYALDMDKKLYIHDEVENKAPPVVLSSQEPLIEITEFKSGTLGATVRASTPGFVVFSEVWAPSWTVYVDGVRGEVIRAYGMLQAVWIEDGTHEILFKYNAFQSWKMKAAFTLSSLALLFVIVIVGRRVVRGLDRPD